MATYKVIQDIEAEDKLVGPLTLRQFIYAAIAAVCLYICFLCYTKGAEFLIGIFFPVAAGAGFFAFPWKGEQPTELWALARLRFMIKPRVRIWDQEGAKDLVTITAPKKLKDLHPARPALSQTEVRSRLKALADTIDSRGWATRNAAYGMYQQTWSKTNVPAAPNPEMSALIPDEDMFSEGNVVSQNLDAMLTKSQENKRQRVMQRMANAQLPETPKLAQLPNIPTPDAASAYAVAPAPAPIPVSANQPQQFPQQGMMQPMQQQPANHWFANGPAYPANPVQNPLMQNAMPNPMMTPPAAPSVLPASMTAPPTVPIHRGRVPSLPTVNLPSAEPAAAQPVVEPAPMQTPGPGPMPMFGAGPPPMMAAPAEPRIESDMPVAVSATPTADEAAAAEEIKQRNDDAVAISYSHMRVLQPAGQGDIANDSNGRPTIDNYQAAPGQDGIAAGDQFINGIAPETPPPMTVPPNPAILDLANNDDLDIATIARQANREMNKAPDEVEIQLH